MIQEAVLRYSCTVSTVSSEETIPSHEKLPFPSPPDEATTPHKHTTVIIEPGTGKSQLQEVVSSRLIETLGSIETILICGSPPGLLKRAPGITACWVRRNISSRAAPASIFGALVMTKHAFCRWSTPVPMLQTKGRSRSMMPTLSPSAALSFFHNWK